MLRYTILVLLGFLSSNISQAQFSVNSDFEDAEEFISENLIGEGVEILSIEFDGKNNSIGSFKDGKNTGGHPNGIGVDNGLLITTGAAELVASKGVGKGIQSDDMREELGNSANAANHPNLLKFVNNDNEIKDFSIIRIEFVPETDTFRLNYIWASEEYPYFVCSEFNDQFGFIISGPGINGDFENNGKNIAIIPGTNLPVSINSLNNGNVGVEGSPTYCPSQVLAGQTAQFYIDNLAYGSEARPAFNGYSTVLEAKSAVVPCETYVIELIVSDLTDLWQDSGVFFEKGSFRTNTTDVIVQTPNDDNTIAEGCESAVIDLNANNSFNAPIPMEAEIKGSATLGVDYNLYFNGTIINDAVDIILPATESDINLQIEALVDAESEGKEDIIITYRRALYTNEDAKCTDRDSIVIYLKDNLLEAKALPDTLYICGSGSQELDGSITTEIAPGNKYENNDAIEVPDNAEIISPISVSGEEQNVVNQGTYPMVCLNVTHLNPKDLDIYLESPNGKSLELMTAVGTDFEANYTQTCFSANATTSINDGSTPYTGSFLPEGSFEDLLGANINGEWKLRVKDTQPGFSGTLDSWSITFVNPYGVSYTWTPDSDISSTTAAIVEVSPTESTLYKLKIDDIYNCSIQDSSYINVTDGYQLSVDTTQIDCFGDNTGIIRINSTNATVNYTWSDGATGAVRENLTAGEYTVTLVGESGCEQEESFTIRQPEELVYNSDIEKSSCAGSEDGSIIITPSGGTAPYSIAWNETSSSDFTLENIAAGTYTATLTDAKDCAVMITAIVEENAPYTISKKQSDLTCFGTNDGNIEVIIEGNSSPITYSWTGPNGYTSTESAINNLSAGDYDVMIQEEDGCETNRSFTITEPEEIVLNHEKTDVKCNGESSGAISLSHTGGTAPYQYSIDNGVNYTSDASFSDLSAGNYSIKLRDANGCTSADDQQVTIIEPNAVTIVMDSVFNIVYGESVTLMATPSIGEDQISSISWNPEDYLSCASCLETIATPEITTNYTLTIVDDNDCSIDKTAVIRVDRSPRVEMPNIFSPNGDRKNDQIFLMTDEIIVQRIENFRIYDRWGNMVFEVQDAAPNSEELSWDGTFNNKNIEAGVYVWIAKIQLIDNEYKVYGGDITVLK